MGLLKIGLTVCVLVSLTLVGATTDKDVPSVSILQGPPLLNGQLQTIGQRFKI